MFKRVGLVFFSLLLFSSSIFSIAQFNLDDYMQASASQLNYGMVTVEGDNYVKAALSPDFPIGPLKMGVDLNLYVPMGGHDYSKNLDWFTFRHLSYDRDGRHGFKWGRLRGVTLGRGLLMDNFDSGGGGSTEFTTQKAGFLGYTTFQDVKGTVMYTAKNVTGVRLEGPTVELKSIPIEAGLTFVSDSDGVDDDASGQRIFRQEQDGMAIDLAYPIGGPLLTFYTEYATLTDQADGFSVGLGGAFFDFFSYRAEYRNLKKGFAPNYYGPTYQSTSFNFETDALEEDINGFLIGGDAALFSGMAKAGVQYEKYGDTNILTGGVGVKKIGPVAGTLNVSKPFTAGTNRTIYTASVFYETGQFCDVIYTVQRVDENGTISDSTNIGCKSNLSAIAPGFSIPGFN